ncbi:MAG TPA: Rieske (2Fe-2S) protein [Micromonosporaceae bacterium]
MSDDEAVTGPGTTRRALVLGAGAAGVTLALAACGGEDPANNSGGGTDDGSGGGSAGPTAGSAGPGPLGKSDEIPVGGGKIFAAQRVVVTQPEKGTFKGFSAICTHQGCPVASVDGGTINCTCHGSKYSIEDGSVKNGPATRPLPARTVNVEGDNLTLG